jgi:hypothetical protein
MRALRDEFRANPRRSVYIQHWEERFDAAGRPWGWRDAARTIPFGKMRSMHRVYLMLGEILRLNLAGEVERSAAQTVQCMKSVHQYAADQCWESAWPITHMPGPFVSDRRGGSDREMEAVLALLRTPEDLARKATGFGHNEPALSDPEDAAAAAASSSGGGRPRGGKGGKKGPKKESEAAEGGKK